MTPLLMYGAKVGAAWLMRGGHKTLASTVGSAAARVRGMWGSGAAPVEQWCDEAGWRSQWTSENSQWIHVDGGDHGVLVVHERNGNLCLASLPVTCLRPSTWETVGTRIKAEMACRNRQMQNAVWEECFNSDTNSMHCLVRMQLSVSGLSARAFRGICRELAAEAEDLNGYITRALR